MTTTEQDYPADKSNLIQKLPLIIVFVGLVFLIIWIVSIAIPVGKATNSLLDKQSQVEALMEDGVLNVDPDVTEILISEVRSDVQVLDQKLAPLLQLGSYFVWLPKIGPLLAAAPELMTMADAGTDAAYFAYSGLKPTLILIQDESIDGNAMIPQLLSILDNADSELAATSEAFGHVVEARESIEKEEELPWRVRNLLELFDSNLPLVEDALALAPVIPEIMALNDQKSYLLIAQNEDELRPSGGFISGAGLLTLSDGAISSLTFEDANTVDDWLNKPYDFPPQPLYDIMGSELFLFRDANFWPEFPVTAEKAMELYTYGTGVPVDGAIAIDQHFLKMLLDVTGPLFVAELNQSVFSGNVIEQIRTAWEPDSEQDTAWWQSRKDFMGFLASSLMAKIINEFQSLDPIYMARTLQSAADERHFQIYLRDPDQFAAINKAGWGGSIAGETDSDFLQVIDTNVGFNKVNAVVDREIKYEVNIGDDGTVHAIVEVSYGHNGSPLPFDCVHHLPEYNTTITYESLLNDCYWNYSRIVTPVGSRLLSSSSHPVPADSLISRNSWPGTARESDYGSESSTVFENLFVLPPGESLTASFKYQLPDHVIKPLDDGRGYSLLVLKQAGTIDDSLKVKISLPEGAELLWVDPAATTSNDGDLVFETDLQVDREFRLGYKE